MEEENEEESSAGAESWNLAEEAFTFPPICEQKKKLKAHMKRRVGRQELRGKSKINIEFAVKLRLKFVFILFFRDFVRF